MLNDFKIAILMPCHKNPKQVNRIIEALSDCSNIELFIHIDRKAYEMEPKITHASFVHILPYEKSTEIKWGGFSQNIGTLALIKESIEYGNFDFHLLMSGQDYLLQNIDSLINYLKEHQHEGFMEVVPTNIPDYANFEKRNDLYYPDWLIQRTLTVRILRKLYQKLSFTKRKKVFENNYYGSQWWCLPREVVEKVFNYYNAHPEVEKYFLHSLCPDESLFHTMVKNLCPDLKLNNKLTYVDWSEGNSSPKTLKYEDVEPLLNNDKHLYFARKFEMDLTPDIFDRIDQIIKK